MSAHDPLQEVFALYLPQRLQPYRLPERIAHGELVFVAKAASPEPSGAQPQVARTEAQSRAWQLFACPSPQTGGHFVPCAQDCPGTCRIEMAQQDYLALAEGQLNLQMAFMQGRLKVLGDIACAMELGALFG